MAGINGVTSGCIICFEDISQHQGESHLLVNIGVVHFQEIILCYRIPRTTHMKYLMDMFHHTNPFLAPFGTYSFWYKGTKLEEEDTMESVGIPNNDTVIAVLTVPNPAN